jgi:hypothetical protein
MHFFDPIHNLYKTCLHIHSSHSSGQVISFLFNSVKEQCQSTKGVLYDIRSKNLPSVIHADNANLKFAGDYSISIKTNRILLQYCTYIRMFCMA